MKFRAGRHSLPDKDATPDVRLTLELDEIFDLREGDLSSRIETETKE